MGKGVGQERSGRGKEIGMDVYVCQKRSGRRDQ